MIAQKAQDQSGQNGEIAIFLDTSDNQVQTSGLSCCPLGVRFYSKEALPLYTIVDVHLSSSVMHCNEHDFNCRGVIVHCEKDDQNGNFLVHVFFTEIPEPARNNLVCVATQAGTLCPYCENF